MDVQHGIVGVEVCDLHVDNDRVNERHAETLDVLAILDVVDDL